MSVHNRPSTLYPVSAYAWRSVKQYSKCLAFWSAIGLPFVIVPLLLSGLATPAETMAFLGLLFTNVLALIAGRNHVPG
jgi:hypothetical protein